jgi:lipopolysaccharide export system protein LptA
MVNQFVVPAKNQDPVCRKGTYCNCRPGRKPESSVQETKRSHPCVLGRHCRLLFLMLFIVSSSVFSLESNINQAEVSLPQNAYQTAHFEADHVSFNANQGTTIYAGHVKITQGSTQITAREITIYKDEGIINKIIATGNPAHYTTLPNNQQVPVDASGQTITHYPQKQVAVISGNGYIKQGANSLKSDHIVYDIAKQTMSSTSSAHVNDRKSLIVLEPNELPGTKTQ